MAHFKLKRSDVKKAIKMVESPTWVGLADALKCHRITIQRFLQLDNNQDLRELLNDRRGNIDIIAVDLIEDKIMEGDTALGLKWLEHKHKREMGNTINVEGGLEIKISIEDVKNKDNKDE